MSLSNWAYRGRPTSRQCSSIDVTTIFAVTGATTGQDIGKPPSSDTPLRISTCGPSLMTSSSTMSKLSSSARALARSGGACVPVPVEPAESRQPRKRPSHYPFGAGDEHAAPRLQVQPRCVACGAGHGNGRANRHDPDVAPWHVRPNRGRCWCSRQSDVPRHGSTGVGELQLPSGDDAGQYGLLAHGVFLVGGVFRYGSPSLFGMYWHVTVRN